MHRRIRKILTLLVCLVLLVASAEPAWAALDDDEGYEAESDYEDEPVDEPASEAVEDRIDQLQAQIDARNRELAKIQEEQKAIQEQLDRTRLDKSKAQEVVNQVGYQINVTESEISTLLGRIQAYQEKIALLEENIEEQEAEIVHKQTEIDASYIVFKKRVRAKYMEDDGTMLGLLLGADSFADFLTHTEYMSRIANHDQELMDKLTRERTKLEQAKADLEDTKFDVEQDKELVEADKELAGQKRQELGQQYVQAEKEVHNIAAMEAEFNREKEKNVAMQNSMKAEIDNLYRQIKFSQNPYAGGTMAWPMPGYYQISSVYGTRFGGSDFHTGTDITGGGCMGAPVVAANDGEVVFVNTNYVKGVGYGIYILVDHGVNQETGQSVSTLYAHLSGVNVSVGQKVARNETIGYCGSTGWSTGAHLHFEVRLDGKHTNSLPYIKS